jgi:hypothetical protein
MFVTGQHDHPKVHPQDASVGIFLSDRAPFAMLHFSPGGPAALAVQQGLLRANDILEQINNISLWDLDSSKVNL